jgi:hypothetical protein
VKIRRKTEKHDSPAKIQSFYESPHVIAKKFQIVIDKKKG